MTDKQKLERLMQEYSESLMEAVKPIMACGVVSGPFMMALAYHAAKFARCSDLPREDFVELMTRSYDAHVGVEAMKAAEKEGKHDN